MRRIVIVVLLLLTFGIAQAQPDTAPGLLVYHVWVRPTAPAPLDGATPAAPIPGTVTAAYLTIDNTSEADYLLVGIDAGFAEMSMLHESSVDDKGVMRMRMVAGLDIPAGTTAQLAPASYHAMLMNVTDDVYPGQAVTLILTFANADGVTFTMPVGALATDFPPDDEALIAANAQAIPNADGGFDVSVVLANRSTQDDSLLSITDVTDSAGRLAQNPLLSKIAELPLDLPADADFAFQPNDIFIVIDNALPEADAFPLTLEFASGKTLTVAVPIIRSAS